MSDVNLYFYGDEPTPVDPAQIFTPGDPPTLWVFKDKSWTLDNEGKWNGAIVKYMGVSTITSETSAPSVFPASSDDLKDYTNLALISATNDTASVVIKASVEIPDTGYIVFTVQHTGSVDINIYSEPGTGLTYTINYGELQFVSYDDYYIPYLGTGNLDTIIAWPSTELSETPDGDITYVGLVEGVVSVDATQCELLEQISVGTPG